MNSKHGIPLHILSVLLVLCALLVACASEVSTEPSLPEESAEPTEEAQEESSNPVSDYVFCPPEGACSEESEIRITIPGKMDKYEVTIKEPLTEFEETNQGNFEPDMEKLLVNFCVSNSGEETCSPIVGLSPPMSIEVRADEDLLKSDAILGYYDTTDGAWKRFEYQWKCEDYAVAFTEKWPQDPQVAWGK